MGSSRKSKKKQKDKRKKHRSPSTSDSSSSSGDEWVEATDVKQPDDNEESELPSKSTERDEWMSTPLEFSGFTRDQLRKKKEPENEQKYMLDRLGQTERELNPYWKDGGSGMPEELKELRVSNAAVGDHGAEWLKRALRRAKEQAVEEGRRLEDVVAERWGSLEKLESMIKDAESRVNVRHKTSDRGDTSSSRHKFISKDDDESCTKKYSITDEDRRKDERIPRSNLARLSESDYKNRDRRKEKYHNRDSDSDDSRYSKNKAKSFMKPSEDDYGSRDRRYRDKYESKDSDDDRRSKSKTKGFMKPPEDDYDYHDRRKDRDKYRNRNSGSDDDRRSKNKTRTFMRPSDDRSTTIEERKSSSKFVRPSEDDDYVPRESKSYSKSSKFDSYSSSSGKGWRKVAQPQRSVQESSNKDLTIEDKAKQNKIEDVIVEPETKASPEPVYLSADERNELAAKLIKAEIMGNTELVTKLKTKLEQARLNAAESENTVVLTVTNSKGFTQPLALSSQPEHGKRRKEKTQTHQEGKRIRYFADDDKFSLQQMFEHEKRSTVEDQNAMFARLASKNVGHDEGANDMDDVFEDMVRVKESDGKVAARERNKAIDQHRRSTQALDNCQWCLDGKRLLKHLVVAIGNKVFLCVPSHESLTEGHCMLVPSHHVSCATQLDEDVWEEMQIFRKALVQMFLSMDMDVIFFESALYLSRTPHMVLQCVPLPKESGDLAPIYFKKAILECETEWATNKKLVDLAGKNVRRAIPRGLPYFCVDFGLQPGFAHVIEDEKAFPKNFAQEIIGGMIDADHSLWRKPKIQKFEEQRKKVMELIKWWQPFSCTKQVTS